MSFEAHTDAHAPSITTTPTPSASSSSPPGPSSQRHALAAQRLTASQPHPPRCQEIKQEPKTVQNTKPPQPQLQRAAAQPATRNRNRWVLCYRFSVTVTPFLAVRGPPGCVPTSLVCTPCQLAAGGYRVAGECDVASCSFRSSLPRWRLKSGGALHLRASRYIDGNTVLGTRAPRRLPDS